MADDDMEIINPPNTLKDKVREGGPGAVDLATLERVFGDVGYQDYLEDQANRQIIRVYLTNAVILGFLPEQRIDKYSSQVESNEGRAALSLHMLMNSVEDASTLPLEPRLEELKPARPGPGCAPHLQVVRT